MADEPISFEDFRKSKRHSYVDRRAILDAVECLELEAKEIVAGSVEEFGAVDVLAHEICAHASAIRRALDAD